MIQLIGTGQPFDVEHGQRAIDETGFEGHGFDGFSGHALAEQRQCFVEPGVPDPFSGQPAPVCGARAGMAGVSMLFCRHMLNSLMLVPGDRAGASPGESLCHVWSVTLYWLTARRRRSLNRGLSGIGKMMKALVRLGKLLRSPAAEWRVIDQEHPRVWWLYLGWQLPMSLLVVAGMLLGLRLHEGAAGGMAHALSREPLAWLLLGTALLFVQVTILAGITNCLAPWFGGQRNLRKALALIAFSMAGIQIGLMLQPLLIGLQPLPSLLGAGWSVYLLYGGMQVLMKVPGDRARNFGVLLAVSFLLMNMLMVPLLDEGRRRLNAADERPATFVALSDENREKARSPISQQKIQRADHELNVAARRAGDAVEQNDALAAAQAARDAVSAMATTVSGGKERQPFSDDRLKRWFPATLLGMSREVLVVEPIGGTSSHSVQARAQYQGEMGRSVALKVVDTGSAAALLAASAEVEPGGSHLETAETISHSYHDGKRLVSVLRWKHSRHVEIQYMLSNGLRVSVDATNVEADALDRAIRRLGLEKLEQ